MRQKTCCLLLAFLLCGSYALCQDLPNAPQPHRFWGRTNKVLFITHAGLETADFAITHRNLGHGGREQNPMGQSLCESGTAGQLLYFGGRTAAVVGLSYLFHRTGHHKLERMFAVYASVDSASGVAYSFAHR